MLRFSLLLSLILMNGLQALNSPIKKLAYEFSLGYTKMSAKEQWWHQIEPLNIYLGALPLKDQGHLELIEALGVTQILSLVEDFELEDGWFNQPVKKADWEERGIHVKQICAVDFNPLGRQQIEQGIDFLHQMIENGKIVYVHCKAGRGRSATIVIAYLMKYHGLPFDEAHAYVKNIRSQINLNSQQRQAIQDYFEEAAEEVVELVSVEEVAVTVPGLTDLLVQMVGHVIEGFDPTLQAPSQVSGYMPASLKIESTLSRRNRYLREFQGNQEEAAKEAIKRSHSFSKAWKKTAIKWMAGSVPGFGMPTSYTISLWHQLREIALIAAIHGHDLHDQEVKLKMLSCLVEGNLLKIPALSVDLIAKAIIDKIITDFSISSISSSFIPAHFLFNYFTDQSAKVSTHALALFAGEHTKPIAVEEYWQNNQETH